ncbi:MAG TPA: peptidyl-prolyl cis-trans isomerase [Fimbriiglobus sp.]|jgi:parvulin-like peptidyl-prolyl isomerase|nr:peptidyl-prolyl cis-trans isomerase [Fimbriiglobus sp.]
MDAAHRRLCLRLLAPLALAIVGCRTGGLVPDRVDNFIRAQSPDGPKAPDAPVVFPADPASTTPAPAPVSQTAVASVVPASGPSPDQATTQIRPVAMIGTDVVITDDEVWQMVRQRAVEYIRLTGTDRDAREKELFREELRKLIDRELILADFLAKVKKNKPHLVDVIKDDAARQVTRQIREIKKQNNFKTEAEFAEVLKAQGISAQALKRQLERNAMMNMYLGQFLKDKANVASLAEVVRYYEEHPDEFKVEDRLKWLDLFVSYRRFNTTVEARQYAEHLLKQIRDGADFVQVVKQHGHGDSALRDGEGVGTKRGEVKPPELESMLFGMTAGQVSDLIPTETGFHVVKVLERDVAGVRPFDEKTQTFIRNKLGALVQKAEYDKLIEDLWRKTNVEVMGVP